MPKSRNRKKHKTQLAKRNKAIKLKKEKTQQLMAKYMAAIEEMKKNNLQNPIGPVLDPSQPVVENSNISDAQVIETLSQEHENEQK